MVEKTVILLVEDDEGHSELIQRAFKGYNHEFELHIALNLQTARAELEQTIPDLIIADLNLPDGQCVELLENHRESFTCPMIVMTSRGDEESAVKIMKAGALDYIVKSKETLDGIPRAAKRALREWQYIQKHKHAIEALRQSEEKYRTIVEQASDVIFTIDLSGRVLDINSSGTSILKYSYNEILKFNIRDLLMDEKEKDLGINFTTLAIGENLIKECYFTCQDENVIPFEISFRKLLNNRIIGIARNITLRKIQELEGRRNREELERFNRLAVGREMRMIELKREVNQLLILLGQNEKYKIHAPDDILVME